MSKATYVGIKNDMGVVEPRKVTNVWTKQNGVLKEKIMPKGIIADLGFKEFMQYLFSIYDSGKETITLVQGYRFGSGSIIKNSDNIVVQSSNTNNDSTNTVVTDVKVDVTEYSTLKIEWEHEGTDVSYTTLFISNIKNGRYPFDSVIGYDIRNRFSRRVDSIDVSSLTGDYHVLVSARKQTTVSSASKATIYRLWLE